MPNIILIGSGVTGAATGTVFVETGYTVSFFDTNPDVVSALRSNGYKAFEITDLHTAQSELEYVFICVPTPTQKSTVQIDTVLHAIESIAPMLTKRTPGDTPIILAIRSTVPVGTHQICAKKIQEMRPDLKLNIDVAICSNPEYLREKKALADARNPRAIMIGTTDDTVARLMEKIYKPITTAIYCMSPEEAEMHKYIHNLYNACKISFFNEMRSVCTENNIDPERLFSLAAYTAEASWNPQYGIQNYGPFSGACLPKDVQGFLSWANTKNSKMPLLEAIIQVNKRVGGADFK